MVISLKMTYEISRILKDRLEKHPKSVLLLGPRQVGKSTLCAEMKPDLSINLADEETFRQHVTDPGLIKRIVAGVSAPSMTILIDEVQRIPAMLNTVQAIIDTNPGFRFLLTGSSARKLKRGRANLLPGRVLLEHLPPLVYWEIADRFDLERALSIGCLPEIYTRDYGEELLRSYVAGYLREEIQAEALTRDLGAYSRFLNLAAELSGQYMNYSKVASDAEINKETVRRYMEILQDTLIVEQVPSFTSVGENRRARQRERFVFFDVGVRNALLGRQRGPFSREEHGQLFEQWLTTQVIYYDRLFSRQWRISSYRDAMGLEIDLIIDTGDRLLAIEIKSATRVHARMFAGLKRFAGLVDRPVERILVYQGEHPQLFDDIGRALPYRHFLAEFLPNL